MSEHQKTSSDRFKKEGVYNALWEEKFDKILTPFDEFLHRQTTSGLLLMVMAIIALLIANSSFFPTYEMILHTYSGVHIGDWSLKMTVGHWIDDGLMALFFFVVGMELKREFLVGELAELRNAMLPIGAAVGGMVVPALIYFAINPQGEAAEGWGIPMATDIAFAVGALALLASRVPKALITFLVALAIVDDLGAVLVIAFFYTDTIATTPLMIAAGVFGLLIMLNLAGIRRTTPYFILAVCLWYMLYQSGVHATIAGVLGAFTVPTIPKYNPNLFSKQVKNLMERFDAIASPKKSVLTDYELRAVVETLDEGVQNVESPLQRLEHKWHMPVAYLVIPIFALANAGIPLDMGNFDQMMAEPVFLGVSLGLILGKFVGITGVCWLMLKMDMATLPKDTSFNQIAGVSLLAAIGFTMSIFVAQLAFNGQDELLLMAKTGILLASLIAGVMGYVWLYLASDSTASAKENS
jgi:Na+:H+ antiporter, NhaA family